MTTWTEPIKILCVDDERNVLRSLERLFLDDDYEIILADSADEGLSELENSGPFQVVISDYRMPAINGVQFLRKVYEKSPDTVRIVLSGYADAGAIVEAINLGHIYKFIPKPWNDEELRVTIHNCLERYFLQKENRQLLLKLENQNQILEEKVQERTRELEIRNQGLEFSQAMIDLLPVGVVGVDENGMIALCNSRGMELLHGVCGSVLGCDVESSCLPGFASIVQQVRKQYSVDSVVEIKNRKLRLLGNQVSIKGSDATVLVFVEVLV